MSLLKYVRDKFGLKDADSWELAKAVYSQNPKYQEMSFEDFAKAAGIEEDIAETRSGLADTAAAVIEGVPVAGMGMLSSAVGAVKGFQENAGVEAEDESLTDRLQSASDKMTAEYLQKHGVNIGDKVAGISPADVATAMSSLGYTGMNMGVGLLSGGAGTVLSGGNPVAGYLSAGGATLAATTGAAKNQIMRSYRDAINQDRAEKNQPALTDAEWDEKAAEFNDKATEYAFWESLPETAGNLIGFGVITAPLKKMVGTKIAKKMAASFAGKAANVAGRAGVGGLTEVGTEAVTLTGQAPIEVEAGLRESVPEGAMEAIKEVYPSTIVLTGIGAGGAKIAHTAFSKSKWASERIKAARDKRAGSATAQAKALAESLIGAEPTPPGLNQRDLSSVAEEIVTDIKAGLYDNPDAAADLSNEVKNTPGLLEAIERVKAVRVGVVPTPPSPPPTTSNAPLSRDLGSDFEDFLSTLDAEDSEKDRIRQVYGLKQQIATMKRQEPTPFRTRVIKKLETDLAALGPVNLTGEAARRNQQILSGIEGQEDTAFVENVNEVNRPAREAAEAAADEVKTAAQWETEIKEQRRVQRIKDIRAELSTIETGKKSPRNNARIKALNAELDTLGGIDLVTPTMKENQELINKGMFRGDKAPEYNNANAPVNKLVGKAKTLDDMSRTLQTTETRGVAYDKEGNRYAFGASSPRWFTKLNEKAKSVGQELFSRKEVETLARKFATGDKLTDKQRQRMFLLDGAITDYEFDAGVGDEDVVKDWEKRGFTIATKRLAAGSLNVGDVFIGKVEGRNIEDEYTVTEISPTGDVTVQDGIEKTLDIFDTVQISAIKKASDRRTQSVPVDVDNRQGPRRKDAKKRKKVSEMTPEDKDAALLIDELTGLKNRRAYDDSEKLPVQASIDLDDLKNTNDTLGHGVGDELLMLIGDAFGNYDQAFRASGGDEFVLQGRTKEEVDKAIQNAYAFLEQNGISVKDEDGSSYNFKGGFSYGISEQRPGESIEDTFKRADAEMYRDKSRRKLSGQGREKHGGRPEGEKDREGVESPSEVKPGDILAPKSGKPFTTESAAIFIIKSKKGLSLDTHDPVRLSDKAWVIRKKTDQIADASKMVPPVKQPSNKKPEETQPVKPASKEADHIASLPQAARDGKPPALGYIQAAKRPDGKWQLFYRGTRNEIFPGELFNSRQEAHGYYKAMWAKAAGGTPIVKESLQVEAKPEAPAAPSKPKAIGLAWIKQKQKPIYEATRITRGKDKGKYRVKYLAGVGLFRTVTVEEKDFRLDEVAPETTIEDFGEKIGGARKDILPSLEKDYTDDDIASQPLSQLWPKKEIDSIEDTFLASVLTVLRDAVPSKPRVSYKLRRWVDLVKALRGLSKAIPNRDRADILKRLSEFSLKGLAAKTRLLEKIPRKDWGRIGSVSEHPDAYSYDTDGNRVMRPSVSVVIDGRYNSFYDAGAVEGVYDSVKERLVEKETPKSKMQFEVRGSEANGYFINKKGDPEYRKLKIFKTSKEALDYRSTNYDDLVAAWEESKDLLNVKEADVRTDENRPRQGADHRKGKDVTPEMFENAFGFRGVEFGNWVSQGENKKERQGMLNHAYDALMDLSAILGVPSQAISLNGELGLGFGSRGHGKASAHYEPDKIVINLTKTRGAGTLAHEWFHALDHYFRRQRGTTGHTREGLYVTFDPETQYRDKKTGSLLNARRFNELKNRNRINPDEWERVEGIRPEVEKAFADLVDVLDKSPMAKRSRIIDKGKSGYWSRIIERAARAFENYVIGKMMDGGYHNDYLANVMPESDFVRDKSRYPYLYQEELPPITQAFDYLFGTIETKETEKGTALFQLNQPTSPGLPVSQIKATVSALAKNLPGAPATVVVQSESDLPDRIQARIEQKNAQGQVNAVFDRGKVYFVADNLQSEAAVESAFLHELFGHYGVEAVLDRATATRFFNQVYLSRAKDERFRRIMKTYGLDGQKREDRLMAGREYVAQIAESGVDDTLLTKLIGLVRDALRKMGVKLKINDNDIRRLIALGARQMKEGSSILVPDGTGFQQYASRWYSEMESTLADKLPNKGNGKMLSTIIDGWAKKGLFKSEELEWSGLTDWLQDKQNVTKEQVLDWLAQNNVRVEEVVKGGDAIQSAIDEIANEYASDNELWDEVEPNVAFDSMSLGERYEYIRSWADEDRRTWGEEIDKRKSNDAEVDTKFSKYQLPGGTNYKELLITLPGKRPDVKVVKHPKRPEGFAVQLPDGSYRSSPQGTTIYYATMVDAVSYQDAYGIKYNSSHFPEPNILAHVRFNERNGPNGEWVLFIEEVQSDWHQKGRKHGYGTRDDIDAGRVETGAPPDAPFKKTWPLLAMKRMVRYAAENGFDVVAWTPGEVQADRYDLSKQLDSVTWVKKPNDRGRLIAVDKGSNEVINKELAASDLPDYIGKDLAEKLVSSDGDTVTAEGLDLKVGGEGMKGFYDKILPAEVNAFFGKAKWGKAKVGKIRFGEAMEDRTDVALNDAGEMWSLPITPEMRDKALTGGMPLFQAVYHGTPHIWIPEPGFPHGRARLDKIGTGEGAQAYGWGIYLADAEKTALEYKKNVKDATAAPRRFIDGVEVKQGSPEYHAGTLLETMGKTIAGVKKEVAGWIKDAKPGENIEHYKKVLMVLNSVKTKKQFTRKASEGNLYALDLPDDVIPKLLDWDKPLSEQSEYVKNGVEKVDIPQNMTNHFKKWIAVEYPSFAKDFYVLSSSQRAMIVEDYTRSTGKQSPVPFNLEKGEDFYQMLKATKGSDKAASEYLASIGIPGLKYLDGMSRDKGDGSRNYVIWDQKTLDRVALLERNGEKLDAIMEEQEGEDNALFNRPGRDNDKPETRGMGRQKVYGLAEKKDGDRGASEQEPAFQGKDGGTAASTGLYRPRNIEDARTMRREEPTGSLANYDYQSQREWLDAAPPKNGKLKIYRATPTGEAIKPGDYVTNSKKYAEEHIKNNLGGKGTVTETDATLDDLYPADGPKEFWYAPASIMDGGTAASVGESSRYLTLAERYRAGDKSVESELQKMVDEAAKRIFGRIDQDRIYDVCLHGGCGEVAKRVIDRIGGKPMLYYDTEGIATHAGVLLPNGDVWDIGDNTDRLKEVSMREFDRAREEDFYPDRVNIEDGEIDQILNQLGVEGGHDPVTYDDNGNIIPLEDRFKEDSDDIRFQLKDSPIDILGQADTIDQEAAAKTRKAIDDIISSLRKTTKKDAIQVSETKTRKLADDYINLKARMKDNAVDVEQKIKEYKAFLMKLPPAVRAKALAGMPKIATAKTKETRQKYFDDAVSQANVYLSREVKKELKRAIHDLRRKPRTPKGGEVKKNILDQLEKLNKTVFGKRPINTMAAAEFHINALSKQKETLEAPDPENKIATAKWQSDIVDIDEKIALINTFGGMKEMSEAQLAHAYEELLRIITTGKTKWQLHEALRKQKTEDIREDLDKEITGEEAPEPETIGQRNQRVREQQKSWNRFKSKVSQFDTMHQSWRFLMDKLARKSGKGTLKSDAVGIMGGAAHLATNEENMLNKATTSMITEKLKGLIGGTGNKIKRWVDEQSTREDDYTLTHTDGSKEEIKLTPMSAAYWWAVKQRGDALAEDGMETVKATLEKMGAGDAFFKQVEDTAGPEVIELAKWLSETLGEHVYQTVNPVYEQRFGAVLDHGRAYTPIKRQISRKEKDVNLLQQYQETPSIIKGALHTLTSSTKSIQEANLLKVWVDHIYDMNHFAAWAMPLQMMESVFSNPETRGYIERVHGQSMNFAIDEFMKHFMAGRRKLKDVFDILDLDVWRGKFSTAVLGLNPTVYIKQLTSIPAMAADIPTTDFIAGFLDFLNPATGSPLKKMDILKESEFIQSRYEKGHTRDVAIASRKTLGQTLGKLDNWPSKLMFLTLLGDMQAIFAGGWAVYRYHLDRGLKNGLSEPEAKKAAMLKFEETAGETQQSSEIMHLGLIQQGNDFAKLMTMFFTAPASYYREVSSAVRNFKANPADSTKRLLLFWVILPAIFEAIASLPLAFDDDEDDRDRFWKRMLRGVVLGPASGLFIARDITETLYNTLFLKGDSGWGGTQYSSVTEIPNTANRVAKDLRKFVEGDGDGDMEKLIRDAVDLAGYVSGYPLPAASNLVEGWRDVAEGDTEHPIARTVGYGKWATGD